MQAQTVDIVQGVTGEAACCLDACTAVIRHCLGQLSDEQVWWRPRPSMNSIGNLLLHLAGNLRQWIVAGVGGAADVRDRPAEFAERGPISKEELLAQLSLTIAQAKAALLSAGPDRLLAQRRIQGSDVTGCGAIFDSVAHFKGHTQEIVCLTRMQLDEAYRFHWRPQTPEQGAPRTSQ